MKVFVPGRWQPLHNGHKALIQKLLDEGSEVIIGIRNTNINKNNPYTFGERKVMFEKAFPGLKVVKIPDFDAIAYGRKVGYEIRHIRLSPKMELISATEIRNGTVNNNTSEA